MKINSRQICFIMIAYTAVSKFVLYPPEIANLSGNDLLFPALIDFLVQTAVIWAVSFLCSKTDKTFYGLLENTFGKVFARIIFGFFAAYFIFGAIFPVFEHTQYVGQIFYDTAPPLVVFLPFFVFAVYAGCKGFNNIGRCADICLPVFAVVTAIIMFMAFSEADFGNLLPVLKSPAKNVFGGALDTFFHFTEPAFMLMFMGHFKYRKGDAARITLSYAGGGLIVLLFLAIFYSVYGVITPSRDFAIAMIAIFFPAIEMIGRIDLIALYALEIAMLFAIVLNIQLAVYCLKMCTGVQIGGIWSLAVNAVLLILLVTLNNYFGGMYVVYQKWLWIVTVVFAVLMPLLAWTLKRRERQ